MQDLLRGPDLVTGPFLEHGNALCKLQRFFLIVRDVDRGDPEPALQFRKLLACGVAELGVEVAQRLI